MRISRRVYSVFRKKDPCILTEVFDFVVKV